MRKTILLVPIVASLIAPSYSLSIISSCTPSPCGPNAACRVIDGHEVCSCLPSYVGSPPKCTILCEKDDDCSSDQVCLRGRCDNPCFGTCAPNAECKVVNRTPICTCPEGLTGDPFIKCVTLAVANRDKVCNNPDLCSENAFCTLNEENPDKPSPVCRCKFGFEGNPYAKCEKKKCTQVSECPEGYICRSNICEDVSTDDVIFPYTGPSKVAGPSFLRCSDRQCGPNSTCEEVTGQAVCTCLPDYPKCSGHQCMVSIDCPVNQACINHKCEDPCDQDICGLSAKCQIINHTPICSCPKGLTGDPFIQCNKLQK